MSAAIPIGLVAEDELCDAVGRKILKQLAPKFLISGIRVGNGTGYITSRLSAFNHAAKVMPYLVISDLDNQACPSGLVRAILPEGNHHNLLWRIAIREIESWILADRTCFARFLQVNPTSIPANPDSVKDPKALVVSLARRSRRPQLRRGLAGLKGRGRVVGPRYNDLLGGFIREKWSPQRGRQHSESLRRALSRLEAFVPTWPA